MIYFLSSEVEVNRLQSLDENSLNFGKPGSECNVRVLIPSTISLLSAQ